MGKIKLLLLVSIILIVIPLTSSAQPFITSSSSGLEIAYKPIESLKLLEEYRIHVHVFNKTSSELLNNTTTNCFYHLYNRTGWDIDFHKLEFESYNQVDYAYTINGGNFSYNGAYAIIIQCNHTSGQTGYAMGYFTVNPTGTTLTTAQAIIYVVSIMILLLAMIGIIFLASMIDGKNKSDEMTGYILYVSNMKYLKMFLYAISYVMLVIISYYSWMISYSLLEMEFLTTILQFIFYFLAIATLPLFVLYTYLNITNLIRDSQVADALSRGLRIT